jgi:outer membrane protein OmpA-like peptidoglycan-associated protein
MRFLIPLAALILATPLAGRAQLGPRGAPALPLALPAGMSPISAGAYRVAFRPGDAALAPPVVEALREIGRRMAATATPGRGRITVHGHATGPANDASAARRLSLARATAVRDALVSGGLEATLVDISPLGRTPVALDAADVLPPGALRPTRTR